ncbi:MAG TPA: MogA/MoaB family molybdenum cofactor biosynthesis protein [Thermoanaerobaculia bacterium]
MDAVHEHRSYSPTSLGFGLLTVSDSRTAADDTGGRTLRELVEGAGHRVAGVDRVRDEAPEIRRALEALLAAPGVDVVVTTGGTGFSPRDVTIDAVAPLFDREIEGFGELFRMLSYREVGAAAMLSRAAAGLIGDRAVFLLPGSPKAVTLAMSALVLPESGHLLGQARRR